MGDTPQTLLFSDVLCGPATLRAAGGTALSDTERVELLNRSLAGEHVEITVDIRPFSQKDDQPNRNFTRFRTGSLNALGRSGKGTVYLHNHDQGNLSERGGTITASKMNKIDGGHELSQTIKVVEAKHVQALLKGTADRFSIGWHATGPINCTVCEASIYKCWWEHWPGKTVELEDGTKQTVEYEFLSAELVETSAVNVPAVVGTTVEQIRASLSANAPTRGDRQMPSTPPAQNSADTQKATEAGKLAERERMGAIMRTAKALKLDDTLRDQHIADGTSADDFRKLAVDAFEASHEQPVKDQGRPSMTAGEDETDKFRQGITSALLWRMDGTIRAGLQKAGHDFEDGRQYRSFTLLDMARACVKRAGISIDGKTKMEILGIANTLSSGYQASGDFAIAFEDAIHKALLARMVLSEMTWRRFCRVGRLEDFRVHRRYRIGEMGVWQEVQENGEYKRIKVPDAVRETISGKKHGNIIAITREAQINDDMGFINEQINAFVDGGLYTVERAVYDFLAENGGLGGNLDDGNPLFDASRNNIGAGAAISVASLDADRVLMRRQRDDNDQRYLQIRPRVLVVATELHGTALVINNAEFDQDEVDTNATNKFRVPNKVRGLYNDIVDAPELSGTRRYSFADPAIVPAIEVAFLEGVETPTVETMEGWNVDGTEMKGRYEFGVAGRDGRGAVTNAGV